MTEATLAAPATPSPFDDPSWFDPPEEAVRGRVRAFTAHLLEEELEAALGRRHGHRARHLVTTFGPVEVAVPRARLAADGAGGREWRSELLPAYKRLSRRAEALIAQAYLAGVNTRRVRRALAGLFGGKVGKDAVSRAWRKTRSAWEAWQARDLAGDGIVRLVLDGTVVKVRLDRRAAAISLLIALGVRRDGQKVVLAIRSMGGESEAAWRAVLWMTCGPGPWPSRSWSSLTAAKASKPPSPPSGTTSRSSAAPCTRSATSWRTRPSTCTMGSRPTSPT